MPEAPTVRPPLVNVRLPVGPVPLPTVIPAILVVPGVGLVNEALLKSTVSWVRLFAGAIPLTQFVLLPHVALLVFAHVISAASAVNPAMARTHATAASALRKGLDAGAICVIA